MTKQQTPPFPGATQGQDGQWEYKKQIHLYQTLQGDEPIFVSIYDHRIPNSTDPGACTCSNWRWVATTHVTFRLPLDPAAQAQWDAINEEDSRVSYEFQQLLRNPNFLPGVA